jgi:hypothetical protein
MAKMGRRALWSLSFVLVYGASFAVVCITNNGPLLAKPETYSLAFMNAVLFVFMTSIFSEAGVLKDPWEMAGALFLGCPFFVGAYYNSVNGVSEGKDKTAERGCAIFPGQAPVLLRQAETGSSGFKNFVRSVRPLSDPFAVYHGLSFRR